MANCKTNPPEEDTPIESDIHMFPNPTTGEFHIEWLKIEEATINIHDAIGNRVYHSTYDEIRDGSRTLINLSQLANGVYHVEVQTQSTKFTKKLVKIQ